MDINLKNIMQNQPVINVGVIGHVSNGKSTMVKLLTGKATQQYSKEKERNITIKLGYANAKIYKCNYCEPPECYSSAPSEIFSMNCKICHNNMELINHVSFVDSPGHFGLMATMMNGTCVMDYTILVESLNNEIIPAPQTVEHVNVTTLTKTPNKIICINKLDLLKKHDAEKKIKIFKKYTKDTILEDSPIIPIVASQGINIDVLCEELAKLPIPDRKLNELCKMIVIRSFNANKPGTLIKDLKGGVIGGSLVKGMININDHVILKPGHIVKNEDESEKRWNYKPINAKVLSILSETNKIDSAVPGGLIGVQLDIDPSFATNDGLMGNILIPVQNNDDFGVFEDIEVEYKSFTGKKINFSTINKVNINVNACNRICEVIHTRKNKLILKLLTSPICVQIGDRVTLSINGENNEGLTIIASGTILDGNPCNLLN